MITSKMYKKISLELWAYVHFDIKHIITSLLYKHKLDMLNINCLKSGINVDYDECRWFTIIKELQKPILVYFNKYMYVMY